MARFDGVSFKVFAGEWGIEEDGDLNCQDLMEDTEGRLWFRVASGLVAYYQGEFQKFSLRSGPLKGSIQTAIASRNGGLWIGTPGDGLKRFENGVYNRVYRPADGLAS